MLTDELRSKIDNIWNAFWAGGIANPLEVIEQITYLLFMRGLDDLHTREENKAKDQWDMLEWGEDEIPDSIEAAEVNKRLFNEETVDLVIAHLMQNGVKVEGGDRLGKTIVFAKNEAHAQFIQKRFDAAYPALVGHFARVITHKTSYAQSLIDDFSIKAKAPHIAIS